MPTRVNKDGPNKTLTFRHLSNAAEKLVMKMWWVCQKIIKKQALAEVILQKTKKFPSAPSGKSNEKPQKQPTDSHKPVEKGISLKLYFTT